MKHLRLFSTLFCMLTATTSSFAEGPYFSTGIKIGEVDQNSALVWVRLTTRAGAENLDAPQGSGSFQKNRKAYREVVEGVPLDELFRRVRGAAGEVRISHWLEGGNGRAVYSPWTTVKGERDFSHQFELTHLSPESHYKIRVEARPGEGEDTSATMEGEFKTAPAEEDARPVNFTVITGQGFHDRDDPENGYKIYPSMFSLEPDFFIHTGDIIYYDSHPPAARSLEMARHHWDRTYSFPNLVEFHRRVPSYFMKDDHDTVTNDCWPKMNAGDFTWDQGVQLFKEEVPMGESTYRTVRWGKDVQLWFVEGRDFRSPNTAPDDGTKTIWGAKQMAWLKESMQGSDATFRLLVSPTPIVGPDRNSKADNHANKAFQKEGDEVRTFLGSLENCFVLCGDRHWQYQTVDPETGLMEFSCGPTTDEHAGGFSQEDKSTMHRFLRIEGGFLGVAIDRNGQNRPSIEFAFHGVDGEIAFRFRETAQ